MDHNEELDIDFDFEKEFGVDLDALLGEDVGISAAEDIDLNRFLAENSNFTQENVDITSDNNVPVFPAEPVLYVEDAPAHDVSPA